MPEHDWQRSSFCGGGGNNCVEVAVRDGCIALRESESPSAVVIADRRTLRALLAAIKADGK
ncbi:DUF397 domain-containing protein [Streptomyces sp. NPDC001890]|uniref:DUF397 domain-containing protein n=1 Tax=Streptomyces sp. NPDC001890 TaxID=3364620 RepID=UPI0036BA0288